MRILRFILFLKGALEFEFEIEFILAWLKNKSSEHGHAIQ